MDLLDGQLDEVRAQAVRDAFKGHPAFAKLLSGMQQDHAALGQSAALDQRGVFLTSSESRAMLTHIAAKLDALPAPQAKPSSKPASGPASSLRDDVLRAEAATPATMQESTITELRASSLERSRDVLAAIGRSRWTRPLSMAAALAICAGVCVWGLRTINQRGWFSSNSSSLTKADPAPTIPGLSRPDLADPSPTVSDPGETKLAQGPGPDNAAPNGPAPAAELTLAQAAELASKGQLSIHVLAKDDLALTRSIAKLAQSGQRNGSWATLAPESTPLALAALWTSTQSSPQTLPPGTPAPLGPASAPVVVASDEPAAKSAAPELNSITPPIAVQAGVQPIVQAVYTVRMTATAESLQRLVAQLSMGRDASTVVLRKLPEAQTLATPFDPSQLIWWTGSASDYRVRVDVPVVVEAVK